MQSNGIYLVLKWELRNVTDRGKARISGKDSLTHEGSIVHIYIFDDCVSEKIEPPGDPR